MEVAKPHADLRRRARRAQWACGLCFALLFAMGLSGVASITLLHDDPLYTASVKGIEGATLQAVMAQRGAIAFIHEWGGYAGILLAGWAALEVFAFARRIRRGDNADWRRAGRWMAPAGILGGTVIIAALVLLLASGVAASGFVDHISTRHKDDLAGIDRSTGLIDARKVLQGYEDSQMAEWHVREMNYVLAFGALILVAAAASIRRVSLEAKKDT
jgi:hypothetical protein